MRAFVICVSLVVASTLMLFACEGDSALSFGVGDVWLDDSHELVLCAGTTVELNVSFFSHAGSDAEFEITTTTNEPANVVQVDIDSTDVAMTHTLEVSAMSPGRATITVEATGHSTPDDDDHVTGWRSIIVANCGQ